MPEATEPKLVETAPPVDPNSELPEFHSQVSKPFREEHREELKALKGKKLQDVLDDHFKLRKTINERGIIVPTKDSPEEEIKAFHDKMGLPRKPEEYELVADEKILPKEVVEAARQFAFKNGLTKNQASAYLAQLQGISKSGQEARDARIKDGEANVKANLAKEMGGDAKAAEAAVNLATKYLSSTYSQAVRQKLIDTGILYDPAFLKEAAVAQAKLEPHPRVDGEVGGKDGVQREKARGKLGHYSGAFTEAFGGGK
jgi:hypothetical protein